MNVFKWMHNFYRPEILEILFEIVRSRNSIDICESSLVARADSNSCRDFECFLYSHKFVFIRRSRIVASFRGSWTSWWLSSYIFPTLLSPFASFRGSWTSWLLSSYIFQTCCHLFSYNSQQDSRRSATPRSICWFVFHLSWRCTRTCRSLFKKTNQNTVLPMLSLETMLLNMYLYPCRQRTNIGEVKTSVLIARCTHFEYPGSAWFTKKIPSRINPP